MPQARLSTAQHSTARHPPREPACPCSRQPMTLSPAFRIVARLSGAVPPKKFLALHDTHPSCQRQAKLAGQLLCYSASLGCTNDPHPIRNLGVPLCTDWVDGMVLDDDGKVCCVGCRPRGMSLPAHSRTQDSTWGHPNCRANFGPSPSTRRCLGGWARGGGQASHSPAEEFDGIASCHQNRPPPPPPARRPPQLIPVHLISHSSLRAPRPVHGSPLSISRRAPPSLQFETCPSSPPGLPQTQQQQQQKQRASPSGIFPLPRTRDAHTLDLLVRPWSLIRCLEAG